MQQEYFQPKGLAAQVRKNTTEYSRILILSFFQEFSPDPHYYHVSSYDNSITLLLCPQKRPNTPLPGPDPHPGGTDTGVKDVTRGQGRAPRSRTHRNVWPMQSVVGLCFGVLWGVSGPTRPLSKHSASTPYLPLEEGDLPLKRDTSRPP